MKNNKTIDIWDFICLLGLGLGIYGVYNIYPPLAFILAGATLLFIGIFYGRK